MEIDVVARSTDGLSILLAEAEWSDRSKPARLLQELQRKAQNFPLAQGKKPILAAFVKAPPKGDRSVLGPEAVLAALP